MQFAVAPMLDWTDIHCRHFYRIISKEATLWTEMITTKAILFGDKNKLLNLTDASQKTILQLGGSDIKEMEECTKIASDFGYKEVNINVGCPSTRVQSGSFGACLMKTPEVVADCVNSMSKQGLKISVKHRIGVDDMQSYAELVNFIKIVKSAGCNDFIIHARKAWLHGLSPKENRTKPPLNYDFVYQIKSDFPKLNITINGGITTTKECKNHLKKVDGVMLGRSVYHNPYILAEVDNQFYALQNKIKTRAKILGEYIDYIQFQLKKEVPIHNLTRHILGLYHSQPYSKKFRQLLSTKVIILQNLINFMKNYGIK